MEHKPDYKHEKHHGKKACVVPSFHKCLQNSFYRLGFTIGKNPSYFIIIPIFVTLLCLTGLQHMNQISDPEYLYTPINGQGRLDREIVETLFPLNYSENFDPSRNTRLLHFVRVLILAKDNGTMLRMNQWNDLNIVDQIVKNVSIYYNEKYMKYKDICAINRRKCSENKVLNLNRIMHQVENGSIKINYPIMLSPYVFPFAYGGAEVDEEGGYLNSAKAISLSYFTKQGRQSHKDRSKLWELKVVETLLATNLESVTIRVMAARSLEDELIRNANIVIPYFFGNTILMFSFSVLSIMAIDWVRSKFFLGLASVTSSIFATITGFGLLMYLQVDFIATNMAIPFLLLGIGLDDQFVLLSSWHRTDPTKSVPERMANAYREAAVSVTITSLTTMLSSFVGTLSPFPAVYYFTIYTGACIFFLYIWFIFFYGGCLALAGYAEEQGRHSIFCIKVTPKSQSEEKNILYRKLLAGGINADDPENEKDKGEHIMQIFFRDYVAAFVNKKPAKVFILLVYICYIMGAICGLLVLEEGLERHRMVQDDSFLGKHILVEDKHFRKYPYRIQVIVDQEVEYWNPENKKKLLQIHESFENSNYIGSRLFTTSWIRHFYRWIERKPKLKAQIHDEVSLIKVLKNDYLPRRKNYQLDISFNKNETAIIGSRFIVQSKWVNTTEQDIAMLLNLRHIAHDAPLHTLTFHQFYTIFDQYLLVRRTAIQTICLAALVMVIIALIFIPSTLACCVIAFSIVSIELGIIGYMSFWDVALDGLTMMHLIICIGFTVDFSAHISYAFLTADAKITEERVKLSLSNLGFPVIQGGISTIMAVILLFNVESYIYRVFFKIIFLLIFFGIMHAIFILPVLLSLLVPSGIDDKHKSKFSPSQSEMEVRVSPVSELTSKYIKNRSKVEADSLETGKKLCFISALASREESVYDQTSSKKENDSSDGSSTPTGRQTPEMGTHNEAYIDNEENSSRL